MTLQVPEAICNIEEMQELQPGVYSIKLDWNTAPWTIAVSKIKTTDKWFVMWDLNGKMCFSSDYEWCQIKRIGDLS